MNYPEEIKRTGVVEVDDHGVVTSFEEKPAEPKSNLAVPTFYIYQKETLPMIKRYIEEGNNSDAPWHFVPWLIKHKDVFAYLFEGTRYDIGTVESYERVQERF
nr:sugar phosphate nucleotidyltransferase [Gracilibacillus sp. YIM 98692]